MKKAIVLFLAAALTAQAAHARQVGIDAAIMAAAMELSAGMERGSRVAVLSMEAGSAAMASYLIDELNLAFMRMGFTAAGGGRRDLPAGDDAAARAAGREMGVRFVVTGSFAPFGDVYLFRTRLIDADGGDILAIHTANVQRDDVTAILLGAGTGAAAAPRVGAARVREEREPGRPNFISVGYNVWGFSLRYDRNVGENFSMGAAAFFNFIGGDAWGGRFDFGIAFATRWFPGGWPFFFGLDLGFGIVDEWREETREVWVPDAGGWGGGHWTTVWYSHYNFNLGVLITPSIGARFGGRRIGFHGGPFVSFPMVIGVGGFSFRFQPGALVGGAF